MSAASKVMRAVGIEPADAREKRVSDCGHQIARVVESTQRQVGRIENTPPSIAQHLGVKPIELGIDFLEIDRLLALSEEFLSPGRDVMFRMENDTHSLRAWVQQLREVRDVVAPYRSMTGGISRPV